MSLGSTLQKKVEKVEHYFHGWGGKRTHFFAKGYRDVVGICWGSQGWGVPHVLVSQAISHRWPTFSEDSVHMNFAGIWSMKKEKSWMIGQEKQTKITCDS